MFEQAGEHNRGVKAFVGSKTSASVCQKENVADILRCTYCGPCSVDRTCQVPQISTKSLDHHNKQSGKRVNWRKISRTEGGRCNHMDR